MFVEPLLLQKPVFGFAYLLQLSLLAPKRLLLLLVIQLPRPQLWCLSMSHLGLLQWTLWRALLNMV
jgi:hypothetical protein